MRMICIIRIGGLWGQSTEAQESTLICFQSKTHRIYSNLARMEVSSEGSTKVRAALTLVGRSKI